MKNKKLLGLLIGLVCIVVCVALLLTFCGRNGDNENPSETVGQQNGPTEGENTDHSEPEETQPDITEPDATQPDATDPEETEPEETQPSGGSTGPSVNTGTGGGYDPGASQPTEPEDATEPEIVVPAAGSENNAYAEQIKETSGSFTTVKIPAGAQMHYRLKTPGSFLRVEDADAAVLYNETVYQAENGVLEIPLPADDTQAMVLSFANKSAEEKAFTVEIRDALGSQTNPILIESVADIQTSLEAGDSDGVYYSWTADQSGVLNITLGSVECADGVADAVITVNGETVRLSEQNGRAQIPVNQSDAVSIQVLTGENADGIHPAAQIQLKGYVALVVELTVSQIPAEIETVTVPAQQSVIYRISGIRGKILKISDESFRVVFDGVVYSADENGLITVKIPAGNKAVEIELFNEASEAKATVFQFGYSLGHPQNPHILTELGELEAAIPADQDGYYYSYTAPASGEVSFVVWTLPEQENAKTDIILTNSTTGQSAGLWYTDDAGQPAQKDDVSVNVNQGDEISIRVSVTDDAGKNLDASLVIYGELYGSEEMPILVEYPGFTAYVPAGETLYYQCFNMSGLYLTVSGTNVQIGHNGSIYTPENGEVTFTVVAEGRNPALFAITNTGTAAGVYEAVFTYPVGHTQNPDALLLGTNTLTQAAGAADYYYTFTAPRAGTVTLTFDANAQWLYAVDNLTQGVYGDTQWSDSDPLVAQMTVQVSAKDVILVRVNTYDTANMFETPAGTVQFDVKYVSGPVAISALAMPTNTTLLAGEYGLYTGQFYDYVLSIANARKLVVYFDGKAYYADSQGEIKVEFPASDGNGTQADLEFTVQNTDTASTTRSMMFSTKEQGSKENPATLQYGPNTMTQTQHNGADYYYTFTATAAGRFTVTFDADADWIYQLTNTTRNQTSGWQISSMGRNSFTVTVRNGDVIELIVNTFDPKTGNSPEGTVEFTVSPA